MSKQLPVVALVGPPNVGKSTLFNTVLGKRQAVTGPLPGTTRDRSYAQTSWRKKSFTLIDTGGLASKSGDVLEADIKEQTKLAILEANVIVFVVDGKISASAAQNSIRELKGVLRQNKLLNQIPVLVVANKVDSPKNKATIQTQFSRLGFGPAIAVSALTGSGVGDLLDAIVEKIKQAPEIEKPEVFATVAVVGRPNVGKSTLVNYLLGEKRLVVSSVPGTTRASVDVEVRYKDKILRFIDTAGMRRRAKIKIDVEEYSLFQAIKSIERADVVILMMDATTRPARFEHTIAGLLKENIKGIVLALNKIDLYEDKDRVEEVRRVVPLLFPFLKFAKVIPVSADRGTNIKQLLDAVVEAKESREKKIDDRELSRVLRSWLRKNPVKKLRSQKKPVIYDLKQFGTNPPNFSLIVNEPAAIHFSYLRYLENQLRKTFGFTGTAVKIKARKPTK